MELVDFLSSPAGVVRNCGVTAMIKVNMHEAKTHLSKPVDKPNLPGYMKGQAAIANNVSIKSIARDEIPAMFGISK